MGFEQDKKNFLSKKDRSRKGSIDEPILGLIDRINQLQDYFTTSSCFGRIVLLKMYGEKKNQSEWIYKSHAPVSAGELWQILNGLKGRFKVWLKFEPFILHVRCRSLEATIRILGLARDNGLKKSGIIAATSSFVVEIEGTDKLETIVYRDKLLITKDYLEELVRELNKKFKANKAKVKRFERAVHSLCC